MNVEKKRKSYIDSCEVELNKILTINESELSNCACKEFDKITKKNSDKLRNFEKLALSLINRIKNIEKDIAIKKLEARLTKHYEQSRRRK